MRNLLFITLILLYGCKKSETVTPTPPPASPTINSSITDTAYLKIYASEWNGGNSMAPGIYRIGTPIGEGQLSFAFINSATIIDSLDNKNYGSVWTYYPTPSTPMFKMSVTVNINSKGFDNTVSMELDTYTTINPLMANLPVTLQLIGHPYKP